MKNLVNKNEKLHVSTGSILLGKYSPKVLIELAKDIVHTSKQKPQNVKDFLIETRSW